MKSCFFALTAALFSTAALGANGRIVAIGDEWLLSDQAFTDAPAQAGQLATNVATFFTGGSPSSFLVCSTAGVVPPWGARGVLGLKLKAHMIGLGHTWVIDSSALTLSKLLSYRGVFLCGNAGSGDANAPALQQYVNAGGNVFIMAGSGDFASSQAEAAAWNNFLGRFGLQFGPTYFGFPSPSSLLDVPAIPSLNPLGESITLVEWGYGQSVNDLEPANPLNEIALYANFTGQPQPPASEVAHHPIIGTYNIATVCLGDLNSDGLVDDADFVIFNNAYNILDCADPSMPAGCPADLNSDGVVDDGDFIIFIQSYDLLVCP